MEIRAQLKQQQKLVMTVQMRQVFKLLQMNSIELDQALDELLAENNSLELQEDGITLSESEIRLLHKENLIKQDQDEQQNGCQENDELWTALLESDLRNEASVHNMRGGYIYNDLPPIESNLSSSPLLTEHLMDQFRLEFCTDGEKEAGIFILGNLDHRGYLDCTYEEIMQQVGVELDDVEGAILIIRELEPLGCAARDLIECLCFQAQVRYPEDPFFSDLITNHLKDFKRKSYQKISDATDIHPEDVEEYHKMLKEFEPCPGRAFIDNPDQTIIPDIKVLKVGDDWQVVSAESGLPKLKISSFYQSLLKKAVGTDKKFAEDKMRSAKFLLESIYKRERTIVQVMESILMRQMDFFENGIEYLRPMILKEIADDIGVHESTVSRITTSKYVDCPHGVFSLKYFFNSGVQNIGGLDLASQAVKIKIQRMIAEENPKKPLSDSAIVKKLSNVGIKLARRTVTKYRESLGIGSSRDRKK